MSHSSLLKLPARILWAMLLSCLFPSAGTSQTVPPPAAEKGEPAAGQKGLPEGSPYLRIDRDAHGDPIAMLTSIISFRPAADAREPAGNRDFQVDLIGAVHVADQRYFQQLNERFRGYDAVLYELVAPENDSVPANGKSRHPVGQLQQGLKSMLNLTFQLEQIDYARPNFVHADMSPEEFAESMKERGESFLQMMLRMMGQAMAKQPSGTGAGDAQLLFALFAPDRSLQLKRIVAEQFQDMEGSTKALASGPDQGSAIIHERNKKALAVLRQQLAAGKKRIGIFYGAAHMPDMAQRLQEDFGLQPRGQAEWLKAWDMQTQTQ